MTPGPGAAYSARPLDHEMRVALVAALVAEDCPPSTAIELSWAAVLRTGRGVRWELQLHEAHHQGGYVRVTTAEFLEGAEHVADVLRMASAETVDRRRRGEDWPPPYWDLPREDQYFEPGSSDQHAGRRALRDRRRG